MKKTLFLIVSFTYALLTFSQENDSQEKTIKISQVNDSQISSMLLSKFNSLSVSGPKVISETGIGSFSSGNFDFINLYKSEKPGESESAYSASYINSNSKIKYSFTAYYKDGSFSKPTLVKAATDRSFINYYDLEENKSVEVVKMANQYSISLRDTDLGAASSGRAAGCGQCVANCIADVYLNHGWASVWATIQSIFVPATGVGIAIGCTARCCLPRATH